MARASGGELEGNGRCSDGIREVGGGGLVGLEGFIARKIVIADLVSSALCSTRLFSDSS